MQYAIEASNLSKTFMSAGRTIKALDDVSLEVGKGEIFGLLGPNGAGKTTLISILAGILSPDKGNAKVLGLDCVRQTKEVQRLINIVSGFSGVIYSLSLEEALMYYCMLYNVRDPQAKIRELIKKVGLEEAQGMVASDMSSGMKQRFLIARGLLNDPAVLLLDEPTVGLDVESAIAIRKMVNELAAEGRTIFLTTHNMFEAEELCGRMAFISKGKIVTIGKPSELRKKVKSKRTIEIHCSKEECVVGSLSGIKGVEAKVESPELVHASVDNYKRMKAVLAALSECDSDVFSVTELEPNFEETYLQIMKQKQEVR